MRHYLSNKLQINFIILLGLLSCSLSFADDLIYQGTYERCQSYNNGDGAIRSFAKGMSLEIATESAQEVLRISSLDTETIMGVVKRKGISKTLHTHLNSHQFYVALRDCFGKDQSSQNKFVLGLILSDSLGKAVTLIGVVKIGKVIYKATKKAKKLYPRVFRVFGVSMASYGLYNSYKALKEIYFPLITEDEQRQIATLFIEQSKLDARVSDVLETAHRMIQKKIENLEDQIDQASLPVDEIVLLEIKRDKLIAAYERATAKKG